MLATGAILAMNARKSAIFSQDKVFRPRRLQTRPQLLIMHTMRTSYAQVLAICRLQLLHRPDFVVEHLQDAFVRLILTVLRLPNLLHLIEGFEQALTLVIL